MYVLGFAFKSDNPDIYLFDYNEIFLNNGMSETLV